MKNNNDQPSNKPDSKRRDFITSSVALGAGVGASSLVGTEAMAAVEVKTTDPKKQKGYQLTEHVADYYKSATI